MTLLLQVDSNELDKHAYDDFSNLVPEYAIILVAESGRTDMAHEPPKTIKVAAYSELGNLVDKARRHPVLLEKDGAVYSLTPASSDPDDLWAGYDPAKVKKAIAETAGSWKDLDTEKLIADIYRARKEGSRLANRP